MRLSSWSVWESFRERHAACFFAFFLLFYLLEVNPRSPTQFPRSHPSLAGWTPASPLLSHHPRHAFPSRPCVAARATTPPAYRGNYPPYPRRHHQTTRRAGLSFHRMPVIDTQQKDSACPFLADAEPAAPFSRNPPVLSPLRYTSATNIHTQTPWLRSAECASTASFSSSRSLPSST